MWEKGLFSNVFIFSIWTAEWVCVSGVWPLQVPPLQEWSFSFPSLPLMLVSSSVVLRPFSLQMEDLGLGRVVLSPVAVIFHQCPKAAGLRWPFRLNIFFLKGGEKGQHQMYHHPLRASWWCSWCNTCMRVSLKVPMTSISRSFTM